MADEDEIIAVFKAEIDQYRAQVAAMGEINKNAQKSTDSLTNSTDKFSGKTKTAASSIRTLGQGLAGVTGLLGITGRLFGVNTSKIEELVFASQQFVRVSRNLADSQKLAQKATEASTAATRAATVATAASSGGIALLITGIIAASAALVAWILVKKDDTEITKETIKLQKELNETNEESIKISNEARIAALENQAAIIKAGGTETVAATEAVAVAEYKVLLEKLRQTQNAIDDANREKLRAQQKFDENMRRLLVSPEKFTEEEKAAARLLFQQKDNELQQLLILQQAYNTQVAVLDKQLVKDVKKIRDTAAEERKKKLQKEFDEELRLIDEQIKKALALYGKESAEYIKKQEEKNKARTEFFKKQEDLILGNATLEASLTKSSVDDENARFQQELNNLEDKFTAEDKATEAFRKRQELLEKEHKFKLSEIRKKDVQKNIDDAKKLTDLVFKAYEEGFNKRQELLDKSIEAQEKNVDAQRDLAARGQKNTLDFEQKELVRKQREQQKEAETQKRVKLLETFLNSLAEFSKTDPKTALSKALLQVALATAATAVFAEEGGVIGEIGARSNLLRKHKGGGDVLLHAQKGEGIIPVDSMRVIGRRNFELLKNVGRFPIRDNVFAMPKIDGGYYGSKHPDNAELVRELRSLQSIVKNKRESSYNIDEFGNYIKTTIENGFKEVTKGKLQKPRFNGRS